MTHASTISAVAYWTGRSCSLRCDASALKSVQIIAAKKIAAATPAMISSTRSSTIGDFYRPCLGGVVSPVPLGLHHHKWLFPFPETGSPPAAVGLAPVAPAVCRLLILVGDLRSPLIRSVPRRARATDSLCAGQLGSRIDGRRFSATFSGEVREGWLACGRWPGTCLPWGCGISLLPGGKLGRNRPLARLSGLRRGKPDARIAAARRDRDLRAAWIRLTAATQRDAMASSDSSGERSLAGRRSFQPSRLLWTRWTLAWIRRSALCVLRQAPPHEEAARTCERGAADRTPALGRCPGMRAWPKRRRESSAIESKIIRSRLGSVRPVASPLRM
jgi:hypothetical protein